MIGELPKKAVCLEAIAGSRANEQVAASSGCGVVHCVISSIHEDDLSAGTTTTAHEVRSHVLPENLCDNSVRPTPSTVEAHVSPDDLCVDSVRTIPISDEEHVLPGNRCDAETETGRAARK